MIRSVNIASFILSLSVLISSANAEDLGCVNSAEGSCSTSIYSILARTPSSYERVVVRTAGYLMNWGEDFYLFPSKEWGALLYRDHAIMLRLPDSQHEIAAMRAKVGRYVFATGHLKPECATECWGSLELIHEVYEVARLDSTEDKDAVGRGANPGSGLAK